MSYIRMKDEDERWTYPPEIFLHPRIVCVCTTSIIVFIDIKFKVVYTLMDLTDWGIWPYILAKLEEPLNFIEKIFKDVK